MSHETRTSCIDLCAVSFSLVVFNCWRACEMLGRRIMESNPQVLLQSAIFVAMPQCQTEYTECNSRNFGSFDSSTIENCNWKSPSWVSACRKTKTKHCRKYTDCLTVFSQQFLLQVPNVTDYPFSAVCDCLFDIFTATLIICSLYPPHATRGHATS
jgi:hypothetical protein